MKYLLRLSILLFITVITFFSGCQKPEPDPPCNDPQQKFWVNPSKYWLLHINLGDTLKFKVYSRHKINANTYAYTNKNEVSFLSSDTANEKVNRKNTLRGLNCNEYIFDYWKILNFKGPEKLQSRLSPEPYADLRIRFHEKEFGTDELQYNHISQVYKDQMVISGKTFYKVNLMPGYPVGQFQVSSTYVDSTIAFYNTDYGILKFIVNDTLVYERQIH